MTPSNNESAVDKTKLEKSSISRSQACLTAESNDSNQVNQFKIFRLAETCVLDSVIDGRKKKGVHQYMREKNLTYDFIGQESTTLMSENNEFTVSTYLNIYSTYRFQKLYLEVRITDAQGNNGKTGFQNE